ncbi:MAG: rRNA maturation RNase YbeY [Bacteroidales bacterium]|nr:rRNA maturation RNase YbeY [Bacteroidales bacterium]
MAICFANIDVEFNLEQKVRLKRWINTVAQLHGRKVGNISYGFCSDTHIIEANMQYLQHDYFTDIITFDYSEGNIISGDLLISLDTVRSNAVQFNSDFTTELHRVMIHGVLHLLGFKDSTDNEQVEMRKREDEALNLLSMIS